jgi:glycosyltransferase involved in cell wall biosynthesis
VVTCWYPKEHAPSGVFIREIALAIHHHSHYCAVVYHVLCEPGSGVLDRESSEFNDDGMKVVRIALKSRFYKWLYLLPPVLFFFIRKDFQRRIIDAHDVHIIHSHVIHPAGIIGYLISKKHHLPLVITEHWSRLRKYFGRSAFQWLAKSAYRHAKRVVAVSDFLKRTIEELVSGSDVQIIPNVVTDDFRPADRQTNRSIIRFVAAGTWKYPKRLDLILDAVESYTKTTGHSVELVLIGDGPQMPLAERSFCFRLIRTGYLPKERLAAEFECGEVLLHASEHETFCLVIAEALRCGLPVVASDVGAIPELIRPENGILVKNTSEAWAAAIHQCMQQTFDRSAIAMHATKYSPQEVGKLYGALFDSVSD